MLQFHLGFAEFQFSKYKHSRNRAWKTNTIGIRNKRKSMGNSRNESKECKSTDKREIERKKRVDKILNQKTG